VYFLEGLQKDNQPIEQLKPEEFRWRAISVRGQSVGIRGLDSVTKGYAFKGDITKGPVTLHEIDQESHFVLPQSSGSLQITVGTDGTGTLTGTFMGHAVNAKVKRRNPNDFPLRSRGFHWISEAPYFGGFGG
jgi:hypothetical protein